MKNILHITPHLGGGVGKVILEWLIADKSNKHTIVTVDYANKNAENICKRENIELFSQISYKDIIEKIKNVDIVLIHFWNHPLLYDFLIKNNIPECRIVVWSHISGAKPPYVLNKKILDISDKFVFTTPISYKFIISSPKLSCILSTGGVNDFLDIEKEQHDGYNIGYVGTVDYAKMHPDYISTITKTNADKIFVVGDGSDKENFLNCDNRFNVIGKLSDVKPILSKMDVFAYMLNPNHYGTGEQVLQEAMASGVVPVVMNNPCERSLVEHNKTGLIASNVQEYIKFINMLKYDVELRDKLSLNAKKYAAENFSITKLVNDWNSTFTEIISISKSKKIWKTERKIQSSYDVFLESLDEYSTIFENKTDEELRSILKYPEWRSATKGTPKQYYEFLSGDRLKELCDLY